MEAECTSCPDAQFQIKHDKREEWRRRFSGLGTALHLDLKSYENILQREFELHMKLVHPDEYAAFKSSSESLESEQYLKSKTRP